MGIAPTGHEMATIRRDAHTLLRDEVQVWHAALASDTHGGQTMTPALVSSGPGELAPMGAGDDEYFAEKIGSQQGWIVTVEHDRTVRTDDELRINGRRFQVIGTDRGRSGAWLQRIPCVEVI